MYTSEIYLFVWIKVCEVHLKVLLGTTYSNIKGFVNLTVTHNRYVYVRFALFWVVMLLRGSLSR